MKPIVTAALVRRGPCTHILWNHYVPTDFQERTPCSQAQGRYPSVSNSRWRFMVPDNRKAY